MQLPVLERKLGERCCAPVAEGALDAEEAERVAADLGVLAHPVRLRLLSVLARAAGQVCVCDLEAVVPVKQPTVSHHLRLLRQAGLIASEKHGLWAYYFVRPEALAALGARVLGAFGRLQGDDDEG